VSVVPLLRICERGSAFEDPGEPADYHPGSTATHLFQVHGMDMHVWWTHSSVRCNLLLICSRQGEPHHVAYMCLNVLGCHCVHET
jgi:hypothetical protein